MSRLGDACKRVADSHRFQNAILGVIVANAVVLGLQTYDGIDQDVGPTLHLLNDIFLGVFVIEMLIRITAYWPRPGTFFRESWNVFDFVTVFAAFVPGVRENATLLRLVRLLRVVRVVSVLPDLRVLVAGMLKSLPPIGSMAVFTALLIYVYGMVGWLLFGEELPAQWGDIGRAMLTLFTVLTLEGWNTTMDQAREVEPMAWLFFVSFVLIASFLIINILIAVIINSVEEARSADVEERIERQRIEAAASGREIDEDTEIESRMLTLRRAMDDLETELKVREHMDASAGKQEKKKLRARSKRGRA
jgi:voltage-gated sodium channel